MKSVNSFSKGELFTLYDGDGDQHYLSKKHTIIYIDKYFEKIKMKPNQNEKNIEKLIFKVVGGHLDNHIVVLSSRVINGIEAQIAEREVASVVVYFYPEGIHLSQVRKLSVSPQGMTILTYKNTVLDSKVY